MPGNWSEFLEGGGYPRGPRTRAVMDEGNLGNTKGPVLYPVGTLQFLPRWMYQTNHRLETPMSYGIDDFQQAVVYGDWSGNSGGGMTGDIPHPIKEANISVDPVTGLYTYGNELDGYDYGDN